MIYISYIVFGFAIIQLLVAAVNVIFSQPLPGKELHLKPLVSVLIPARNEEKNITSILGDLQKQPYQNIEIFVFDDQSDDKTTQHINMSC